MASRIFTALSVVTDRQVLDQQLQEAIRQIDHQVAVALSIGSELVDDKRVDEKSAWCKLAKWLSLNPVNVG